MSDESPRMMDSAVGDPVTGQGCRRFHLGDGMVLIAAIAVGLALGKVAFSESYPKRPIPPGFHLYYAISCGQAAAVVCLASLSAAYLPIRLRRPGPPLVRVMIQPGSVACVTSIASTLTLLGVVAGEGGDFKLSALAGILSIFTGMAVACAWAVLWFCGGWKPEPGWIDGMGRLLGLCWIAMPLVLFSAFLF